MIMNQQFAGKFINRDRELKYLNSRYVERLNTSRTVVKFQRKNIVYLMMGYIKIKRNYAGMLIGRPIAILYFMARKITAEGAEERKSR